MQAASQEIRNSLWDKLKDVYNKYAVEGGQIETERVQQIVRDALGETSKSEIDYVINNMFRVDSDNNGTVSFLQFGNFLFKRHCGEMSLQKMHKEGMIKNGTARKITEEEFWMLLNKAYAFLKVKCPRNTCDEVFAEADQDKDGLITYVQYFKFIDRYVCLSKNQYEEYEQSPVKNFETESSITSAEIGREWRSQLRLYLWAQLRHLYGLYVGSTLLRITDESLKGLIMHILGPLPELQLNFILNGLYILGGQNLQFISWAILFLSLVSQLFLSEFQKNHPSSKKTLSAEEFIHLLKNTFKFLAIYRVKRSVLLVLFAKIDKDNDGLITYVEYLDWIKRYLCVRTNRGDQFYTNQDDAALISENLYLEPQLFPKQAQSSIISSHNQRKHRFYFSNTSLARRVRARVYELLVPFDANLDKKFDEKEISNALAAIMKEDKYQIQYFVKNVFRYDRNRDGIVTYDELTNFCVEQHFGEIVIQRLHMKRTYQRGSEHLMSKKQFAYTLNNALSYIKMQADNSQIDLLWNEINLNRSGWITYEIYFLFLRYYFGSQSGIDTDNVMILDQQQKWVQQLSKLHFLERFTRWVLDQLRALFLKYDFNQNLLFQPQQIQAILKHIFKLTDTEIQFIMLQFFKFQSQVSQSLTFEQLVKILISVYFIYFSLKKFRDQSVGKEYYGRINLEQFMDLMRRSTFYLRSQFLYADLKAVFEYIDADHDGWITYREYIDFIVRVLGNNCIDWELEESDTDKDENTQIPEGIDEKEWDFVCQIWDQLRAYFDAYDQGSKKYLSIEELKKFVIEVLEQNTERQLEYIMLNLFRVDPNNDKNIQFHEFAPFILKHAGEISLQRFHRYQILGKKTLSENELFIVFSKAFCFLKSMPKSHPAVHEIYLRIGMGCDPTYAQYLHYINKELASKYRKT